MDSVGFTEQKRCYSIDLVRVKQGNTIQVCTFHDGCKQGIDQQIFNRKSISRKITHPQSLFNWIRTEDA